MQREIVLDTETTGLDETKAELAGTFNIDEYTTA